MASESLPRRPGPSGHRLSNANSRYLRSAAEQAIDWHPWGPEPFEIARRTRRPILLDIGASWCHWCHVMDEGTYSDPEVARLLQQGFVAIKVDRDEHPEVDRRYQRQVGALTGEGGWPLTAFLAADGNVFLGGTYFPAVDANGRPGFRRLLREVRRLWDEEPLELERHARAIQEALSRHASRRAEEAPSAEAFVRSVRRRIHDSADPMNGGFGDAPKFPHPTGIAFLLWDEFANGVAESGATARLALDRMAAGGIYDQIGGGFHRYSVDEGWHIPHFEKMAVDNSALLDAYVQGAERFGLARYGATIRGTIRWLDEMLGDPEGGWGASQDADNAPGDDGSYYTWTRAQLHAILEPTEFRLFTRFFGVGSEGRMPEDPERSVLFQLLRLEEAAEGSGLAAEEARATLDRAIEKVRAARALRAEPAIDRALYASLNGGLIAAYARAGAFLCDRGLVDRARRAADRFLAHAYRAERGVAHRLEGSTGAGYGMLEDQAEFALGLAELAGATAIPEYALRARELLELIDREFRGEDGLLRDVAPSVYDGSEIVPSLPVSYPLEDSPHRSANATAILAALRLGALTEDDLLHRFVQGRIEPIARRVGDAGLFAAGSALVAGLLLTPPVKVVIEGTGPEALALERAARESYHPMRWVFRERPPAPFRASGLPSGGSRGPAIAYVCVGSSCRPPITDPAELAHAIAAPATES